MADYYDMLQYPPHHGHGHHTTAPVHQPTIAPVPKRVWELAGDTGDRALWVVFVIMLIASVAFVAMSWSVPVSKRIYHTITAVITLIATVSYFAMATGSGIRIHHTRVTEQHAKVPDTHVDVYRAVYVARYIDWLLTTPLLLFDLCLVAGLPGGNIFIAIIADIFMIITGLFAAVGRSETPQKWGYYAMGCIAYLAILWQLIFNGRAGARRKGAKVGGFFDAIAGFTLLLWTAYPIIWGFADGARILSVDGEIVAYAILDVLAKPVFGLWLLLTHISLPETHVEIGGWWAHGFHSEGTIRVGDDDDGA